MTALHAYKEPVSVRSHKSPFVATTKTSFSDDFQQLKIAQQIAAFYVFRGTNCLITGGGGVGKSHLIRFLEKYAQGMVLTATTGIAGVNIEGQTLDSFIGFNQECESKADAAVMPKQDVVDRLRALKILLVDEASMLRIDRMEMVDIRLRTTRNDPRPFGGVQVILCCDLMQLGPVIAKNTPEGKAFLKEYGKRSYFFESPVYDAANFTPCLLDEYVRNGDPIQRKVLRSMRMGRNLPEVVSYINQKATGQKSSAGSVYICKTNARVAEINKIAFDKLKGQSRIYKAQQEGRFSVESRAVQFNMELRVGARVMMTVNDKNKTYVNGDLGCILAMYDDHLVVLLDRGATVSVERYKWTGYEYVAKMQSSGDVLNERVIAGTYEQFPVRLGYAITAHKSQGLTLDSADIDLSGEFNAPGLAYVVISRVRDFSGLRLLKPLTVNDIRASKVAADFTYKQSMMALDRRKMDEAFLKMAA